MKRTKKQQLCAINFENDSDEDDEDEDDSSNEDFKPTSCDESESREEVKTDNGQKKAAPGKENNPRLLVSKTKMEFKDSLSSVDSHKLNKKLVSVIRDQKGMISKKNTEHNIPPKRKERES